MELSAEFPAPSCAPINMVLGPNCKVRGWQVKVDPDRDPDPVTSAKGHEIELLSTPDKLSLIVPVTCTVDAVTVEPLAGEILEKTGGGISIFTKGENTAPLFPALLLACTYSLPPPPSAADRTGG